MQCLQGMDPFLFDKLIITRKLPCDHLLSIFWGKVKLLKCHRFSNILSFHHMPGLEFDGEIIRVALKSVYFFNI